MSIALHGALIKVSEVLLLFPFHHKIHKSQANSKIPLNLQNVYKGVQYQIIQAPLNRYIDISLYEKYGTSYESSLYSSLFKSLSYPLHTAEVNLQLKNKLPSQITCYYRGFVPYAIVNMCAYNVWFNSLNTFNKNISIENQTLKNGLVGFMSGLTVDLLTHPLKTIKTNLQNKSFKLCDIVNPRYLFRGISTKLLLSACQTAYFNIWCPL